MHDYPRSVPNISRVKSRGSDRSTITTASTASRTARNDIRLRVSDRRSIRNSASSVISTPKIARVGLGTSAYRRNRAICGKRTIVRTIHAVLWRRITSSYGRGYYASAISAAPANMMQAALRRIALCSSRNRCPPSSTAKTMLSCRRPVT